MIAPEVQRVGGRETSRTVLLRNNLLVSALIFVCLQFWRPYFFLTDDNLDGGLPYAIEMGHRLLSGHSPFFSSYLFGGNYDALRDPTFFAWHPIYFLSSLLAPTPLRYGIMDADVFMLLMLSTAGFVNLGWYLRKDLSLTLSDGWLMFYTISFTYSMYVLTIGASWFSFMANQAALPWLVLGILHRSPRGGLLLVALFNLHQLLGGHLEPTLTSTIFLTIFALAVSIARRSIVPMASWTLGYGIAAALALPLLIWALSGFAASSRSFGVPLSDMQANNIPLEMFPTSLFLGTAIWFIHPPVTAFTTTYTIAMGSCAAAWCLIPALARTERWRKLEWITVGMMLIIALMVIRPLWMARIMIHLPLLRSTRWPFRELMQFQFFLHLFLLIRRPGFWPRARVLFAILSSTLFLLPLLLHPPPTLNPMVEDRRILLSGGFDQYWAKVRPFFKPGDRIAAVLSPKFYADEHYGPPFCLLSTFDYSCMSRVTNIWGWSQTPPEDQFDVDVYPYFVFGAYRPKQDAELLKERPPIRLLTLESLVPLRITLTTPGGPTIDLTPYIPPQAQYK